MRVQDVSSPARTRGSDRDVAVMLSGTEWAALTRFFIPMENQIRVGLPGLDAYIVPEHDLGTYTQAAIEAWRIQCEWDEETFSLYAEEKFSISHLKGEARKLAKMELANKYGLPTVQYSAPAREQPVAPILTAALVLGIVVLGASVFTLASVVARNMDTVLAVLQR